MCKVTEVLLVLVSVLQWRTLTTQGQPGTNGQVFYAVEMDGGERAARALAEQHGLEFISRIGNLNGHFTIKDSRGRPDRAALQTRLSAGSGVRRVRRQQNHYRDKRAAVVTGTHLPSSTRPPGQHGEPDWQQRDQGKDHSLTFNDPLWPLQWELFAQGEYRSSVLDLNVMPAWERNITGSGVVVSIIDDGLDHTNPDLRRNFEAFTSFDLRGVHGLSHDPMPRRDEENGHGTRCAGEVAMEANNSYCGVGIAFNARIGGIRLLDGSVTDAMEATALTFNNQFIDLYVCCWGPRDDGAEMGGPGPLTETALRLGTQQGRGGRGSVFVWASGNGGMQSDHCGADGYVNSIRSIAIGAVTHAGKPALFSEPCPGVMAVTLTGAGVGGGSLPLVTVSNLGEGCVTHFAGTSSAAPIAAGILALVLEANPELTWRDVQHLIARTAKVPDPREPGWSVNGAGYHIHHRYGFGVLDAGLMVQQALLFHTVLPHRKCMQEVTLDPARTLSSGGGVSISIQSDGCQGRDTEVNTLEHVQVTVSISSVCRGDLSVSLESPSGTVSLLLAPRPNDASAAGLSNWTLMTVHCWGERPRGRWTLTVTDKRGTVGSCVRAPSEEAAGAVLGATLTLYGTYGPRASTPDGPMRGVMSMGTYHPVPLTGVSVRDQYPLQELIQWAFDLERERKVCTSDIPVPQHRRKSSTRRPLPAQRFTSLDMDDTDGEELGAPLMELWNTLRDRLGRNWTLRDASSPRRPPPAVGLTDSVLRSSLESRPTDGAGPYQTRKLHNPVGGATESWPPQLINDRSMGIQEGSGLMRLFRASMLHKRQKRRGGHKVGQIEGTQQ